MNYPADPRMGNVHHLQRLGQGVGNWNAWRKQEPEVRPDLTSANLRGADLSGMDLSGSVLSLANLRKACMAGAVLKDCSLPRANLEEADLSGANLAGANLAGASLLRARLSGATMRRANLAGANLSGKMDLSGVDLTGANLAGAKLIGANLSGATLVGANLAGVDARDADFTGTDLTDAVTAGARLDNANLSGAIIRQTASSRQKTMAYEPSAPEGAEDLSWTLPEDGEETSLAQLEEELFAEEAVTEALVSEELAEEELVSEPLEVEEEAAPLAADDFTEAEEEALEEEPVLEVLEEESLAEPEELEAVLPEEPVAAPMVAESIAQTWDDSYFRYETRDMAILSLYSNQVGTKTEAEKARLLNLLVQYNRNFVGHEARVPMTTVGKAIMAGFENPTDALHCGSLYISMLREMGVESYVAITWGASTFRVDSDAEDAHDELIANSIPPTARLMPIGTVGEVLVLEEVYANPLTQRDLFTFERVSRKWTAAGDSSGEGVDVLCYSVRRK